MLEDHSLLKSMTWIAATLITVLTIYHNDPFGSALHSPLTPVVLYVFASPSKELLFGDVLL